MGDKPRYSEDEVRANREAELEALFGKATDAIRALGGDIGASAPTWAQLRPQLEDELLKRGIDEARIARFGDVVVFGGSFALTIVAAPVSAPLAALASGTYVAYWVGRKLLIEAFPDSNVSEPPDPLTVLEFLKKKAGDS